MKKCPILTVKSYCLFKNKKLNHQKKFFESPENHELCR
jgi:hypothetical protein